MATIAERQEYRQEIIENSREVSKFLSTPQDRAVALYRDGSCIGNLGARALSLAQMIVSIVTVPLAFLGLFFNTFLYLMELPFLMCMGDEGQIGLETMRMNQGASAGIAGEHLARIPESFVGIFFPSILLESLPTKG